MVTELSRLRVGFAHQEARDKPHPHPRDVVMNMVVVAETEAAAERASAAMRGLALEHPSRTVILIPQARMEREGVDVVLESHAHRRVGGPQIEYEQVLMRIRPEARGQIPSLIGPLMMADVRSFLWWMGSAPLGDRKLVRALELCDGLIVDSAGFTNTLDVFLALERLLRRREWGKGVGDLHWARTTPWREAVAQAFNAPERRECLAAIRRVQVEYAGPHANPSAACLLVGWMADRLGWRPAAPARLSSGGGLSVRFRAPAGQKIQVTCRTGSARGLLPGEITGLVVESQADAIQVALRADRLRGDEPLVSVSLGRGDQRLDYLLPMTGRDEGRLLGQLLPDMGVDHVYAPSLRAALGLLKGGST